MFANCSNPDCRALFDYREGRLIRLCKPKFDGRISANESRIEHFWLCESCSKLYEFEYQDGIGMTVRPIVRVLRQERSLRLVARA